ncbi:outer membrane protein, adhesin transport system [Thauera chlorobenzoica]|uniref:TolC-like protein n=2 Tax=Thauera chlorobenzoica TaxID=96773 RepID=A0A1H5XSQ2_9RHOO|nr:TolC family outer membrane protein [Thauera chlorobenzoica]APR04553.1 TolC-like protein [Thauera chlorobenzoica]SEG14467.1 outer membrane protein, adhesin transport system [Thauera chlorobenzoica]
MKKIRTLIALAVLGTLPQAYAQVPEALQDAARMAVTANPEVQARWHAFLASEQDRLAVRGGYFPQVDLIAGAGYERQTRPDRDPKTESYNHRNATLALNQMVYDGFFTRNEVARFGHAKLVRYYELVDAAERTSMEVVRVYSDVLRYRELVKLAQDNYVRHKQVFDQISGRTAAGVGRGVDLEQATGRLALAESNLLTEVSNLHDVSARYLRIVGVEAPENLPLIGDSIAAGGLPPTIQDALREAFDSSATLNAAVEDVAAAQRGVESRRAAFHPRLDLRARQSFDRNLDGVSGESRDSVVELVLTYNLTRGGADQARLRQAAEAANQSKDLREKVCRDIRQTLSIAYNDVNRIKEQLIYLDQHQLSTEKTREAYRQQFDIGQRTLLDLLDTENEFFEARRAYVRAVYDRIIAQARTLTEMSRLTTALNVAREGLPSAAEVGQERAGIDPASVCPPEAPTQLQIDKEAVFAEAMRAAGR